MQRWCGPHQVGATLTNFHRGNNCNTASCLQMMRLPLPASASICRLLVALPAVTKPSTPADVYPYRREGLLKYVPVGLQLQQWQHCHGKQCHQHGMGTTYQHEERWCQFSWPRQQKT